jgi:hypothetical protein
MRSPSWTTASPVRRIPPETFFSSSSVNWVFLFSILSAGVDCVGLMLAHKLSSVEMRDEANMTCSGPRRCDGHHRAESVPGYPPISAGLGSERVYNPTSHHPALI